MREINIDESFRARVNAVASEEAKMIGSLNGSIEKGGGNYAGVFGELLFIKEFGGNRENSYDYDIMYEGLAIDVKTKRRSVSPKPYYECSIPNYNTEQDCDYYYFISIRKDYSQATLLGYKSPENYYEEATFHEEGDVDPDNNFEFKTDSWNLPIRELKHGDPANEVRS